MIRHLVELAEKNDLEELDIQYRQFRVLIRRSESRPVKESAPGPARRTKPVAGEKPEDTSGLVLVNSPLAGVFYRAPGPGESPFVDVGEVVSPDQTLCIIEAMKTMNEITSEVKGEITKILVENAQPVVCGQTLFYIKPA